MVFEKIIEHFKQKKQEEKYFYVLEYENSDKRCVIEHKILEIVFSGNWNFRELENDYYVESCGWHIGEDNKVYESFNLTKKGDWLYDLGEVKSYGMPYLIALHEINNNIRPKHLKWEKNKILDIYKKNGIKGIYPYTTKVLRPVEKEEVAQTEDAAPKDEKQEKVAPKVENEATAPTNVR